MAPVVRNGNLFVPEVAFMLKHVGQIGCDVQDVLYVVLAEDIQVSGVFGAAQVKIGNDLDREGRLVTGDGALFGLCGTARLSIGLPVRTIRTDPEVPKTQNRQRRRRAWTGAVKKGLTVFWVLCVKLHKSTCTKDRTQQNKVISFAKNFL